MVSDKKKSNADELINENLQRVYEEALNEEIPDEFLEIIARLKSEKQAKSDGE
ncbi:MAG: NepR family anti-sigma factor [Pseudomonadota bacterium]